MILDAITCYNRLNTLEESANKVSDKYGIKVAAQNISNWLNDFKEYLPFLRMRDFIEKKYNRKDIFMESKMFHGQIYDFRYHRAKTALILEEDFKHYKFRPIQEFLELVTAECPHRIFKESTKRASEYKDLFNLDQVKIVPKDNMTMKNARFVLQEVVNNKLRHKILQEFMLVNDSVTVACEVPVLLDKDDLLRYQNELNFLVPLNLKEEEIITGHIDIIQIRNGMTHIMDFKPGARKAKPIEQLTIYTLALSRLTTLRLFHLNVYGLTGRTILNSIHSMWYTKRRKGRHEENKGS